MVSSIDEHLTAGINDMKAANQFDPTHPKQSTVTSSQALYLNLTPYGVAGSGALPQSY